MAFRKEHVKPWTSVGSQMGSDWLRNYPEQDGKINRHNTDEHDSVVEEDTIMYHNLQLLEMPDALAHWPEFKEMPFTISEGMFLNPNRKAMHVVVYFLMARLLGRDATRTYFKGCWPPTSMALIRDFKNRSVEAIKKHAEEWQIAPEKLTGLGAMFQRHAGLKMVDLLCGMSHVALMKSYEASFPEDRLLLRSVQDPLQSLGCPVGELDAPEALAEMIIDSGKAKLAVQQKRFLKNVQILKSTEEAHASAVGRVLEEHALLSNEAAAHAHTTNLIAQQMERDENHSLRHVLKNGKEMEAVVENVVDMDIHLQRVLGRTTACQISQSSLDINTHSRENAPGTTSDIQGASLGGNAQSIHERSKSQETSVMERVLVNHAETGPVSILDVLSPPGVSSRVHFPLGQRKPPPNILCGDKSFSRHRGNTKRSQRGQDEEGSAEILLTDVLGHWHKSLQDLQAALNSMGKNRNSQRLLSDYQMDFGSEDTLTGAYRALEENLQTLESFKDKLQQENAVMDEEMIKMSKQLKPLVDKTNVEGPSESDFVVQEEI